MRVCYPCPLQQWPPLQRQTLRATLATLLAHSQRANGSGALANKPWTRWGSSPRSMAVEALGLTRVKTSEAIRKMPAAIR